MSVHRLAAILRDAADLRFPSPDGLVEFVGSPLGPSDAVVAFTAHSVVAAAVDPDQARSLLSPGDLGATMSTRFLTWMGERLGAEPGMLDVVLVARGRPPSGLALDERNDLLTHPRVTRAARYRRDLSVYADPDEMGVAILARGLAGRLEISVEVDEEARAAGFGRKLVAAAMAKAPPGEPVFAQISPGNTRSLRAFLAVGFRPVASEVLFLRD